MLRSAVYEPDPSAAVLIDEMAAKDGPSAASSTPVTSDTADVARYPRKQEPAAGVESAPIAKQAGLDATVDLRHRRRCGLRSAVRGPRTRRGRARRVALHGVQQGQQVGGLRAFLYTGPRVTSGLTKAPRPSPSRTRGEFGRYGELLGSAGALPVYPTPSRTDRTPGGSECEFQNAFAGFPEPLGVGVPQASVIPLQSREVQSERHSEGCATYYAFRSRGNGGAVRVIMLDTSASGQEWALERGWLESELGGASAAREPAIVVGNADLNAEIASGRAGKQQAAETAQAIIVGDASAYFYDAPEQNIEMPLANSEVPAFGSGTLGYSSAVNANLQDFLGASGFLLVHVDAAARNAQNVAPVEARLIPNVGEIALEAQAGTLLRRSQVASFAGLARRPRAGGRSPARPEPERIGALHPDSRELRGRPLLAPHRPRILLQLFESQRRRLRRAQHRVAGSQRRAARRAEGRTDPRRGIRPLLCLQRGHDSGHDQRRGLELHAAGDRPGGKRAAPLRNGPGRIQAAHDADPVPVSPNPAPTPATSPPPTTAPPPVPPPPAILAAPHVPRPATPAFFVPALAVAPLLPFVPPPIPTPARPSPPSGTSAVTSPVEVAQEEEESEEAPESVSNKAVAYRSAEHELSPYYLLGVVLLAAFAGASVGRRRRGRRDVRVAPATITSIRTQRRWGDGRRRGL